MKTRDRQRANRRLKEEMLELRDTCGVKDPTPYEAVKDIIKELRKINKRRYQHGICTDIN
ncbi:MAG: hypothetical protein K6E85_02675 [Lachnospiraceae bacterium]|nr:hypothetical protein [Lachnospiraceae bacterium]